MKANDLHTQWMQDESYTQRTSSVGRSDSEPRSVAKSWSAAIPTLEINESYKAEYEALVPEYALASTLIAARKRAGLTQAELAIRMHVKQPFVARLESGRSMPSLATLTKYANATGTQVQIELR